MKPCFQDLVDEASRAPHVVKTATGGLFVGLSTEANIWGQKRQSYKSEEIEDDWIDGDEIGPEEETAATQAAEPKDPSDPAQDNLIDEDLIVAELALDDTMDVRQLQAVRRAFARRNHPDTAHTNRSICEARMKIANRVIDERIRLRRGS